MGGYCCCIKNLDEETPLIRSSSLIKRHSTQPSKKESFFSQKFSSDDFALIALIGEGFHFREF
jgi:hypothetical protein